MMAILQIIALLANLTFPALPDQPTQTAPQHVQTQSHHA
jgi:hypothetical protein